MANPGAGKPCALYKPETKRVWLFVSYYTLNMDMDTAERALAEFSAAVEQGRKDRDGK